MLEKEISVLTHKKNQFHTIKFKKPTIKVKNTHNKALKHTNRKHYQN